MEKRILNKIHDSEIKILDEIDRICKKNKLNYFLIGGTLLGAIRHKGFIPWDDDLDIAMPREDYELFLSIAPKELNSDYYLDDISTNKNYALIFAKVREKNSNIDHKKNSGLWVDIFPFDYTNHYHDKYIKLKWKRIKLLKAIYIRKNKENKMDNHFITNLFSYIYKPFSMKRMYTKIYKLITKENYKQTKYYINYGSQYGVLKQTHAIDKIFPLKETIFENKKYLIPNDYKYVLTNIYGPDYMTLPPKEKRITHNPSYIKFSDGEEVSFHEKI